MRFLFLLTVLWASCAAPASAISPLVHVRSTRADGAVSHGSGVALGGDLVLTARHVLACGVFDSVEWGADGQRPARPVHADAGLDLVLLSVPGLDAPPLPIAASADGLATAEVEGVRSGTSPALVRWADGVSVGLEVRRLPGDSGGPVLGEDGLLAVVTEAAPGSLGQGLAVGPGPDALRAFLGARRRAPCSARGRRTASTLSRARSAQLAGEPARALQLLGRMRGRGGIPRAVATRRARALSALGRFSEAADVLTTHMTAEGRDARRELESLRARLMADELVFLDEYVQVAGHAESGVLLRLASELYAEAGQPAEAVDLTDDVLAVAGDAPHLLAARCRARRLFGDLAGAREDCGAALRGPVRPLSALLDLGSVQLELREYAPARVALDEAAGRADGAPVVLLRALATLASGQGEPSWSAAKADADAVLDRDPPTESARGPALFVRAVAGVMLGELDAAERDAEAAREASPNDPRILRLVRALRAGVAIDGIDGDGRVRLRPVPSP